VRRKDKGLYVAIEGISGAGKTRQCEKLVASLSRVGHKVLGLKEPHIEAIRAFLYHPRGEIEADVEALIFAVDRLIQQRRVVIPALDRKRMVISDRSVYASLAYQGARGLAESYIRYVNRSVRFPDRVILLDISPHEGLKRVRLIGRGLSRFENPSFMAKVRQEFLDLAKKERRKFIIIDASQPEKQVFNRIWEKVNDWLPQSHIVQPCGGLRASHTAGGDPPDQRAPHDG
jgi:dTMP kinase